MTACRLLIEDVMSIGKIDSVVVEVVCLVLSTT